MIIRVLKYFIIVITIWFCTFIDNNLFKMEQSLEDYSRINMEKLEVIGTDQKENFRIQGELLKAFIFINNYLAANDRYGINTTQLMNDHKKIVSSFEKHRVLRDELMENNAKYSETTKDTLDRIKKMTMAVMKAAWIILCIFILFDISDLIFSFFRMRSYRTFDPEYKIGIRTLSPLYFFTSMKNIRNIIKSKDDEIASLNSDMEKLTKKIERLAKKNTKNTKKTAEHEKNT